LAANKAVTVGIQRMTERIRPDTSGRPRIYALRTALVEADPALIEAKKPYCTAQEFDCYLWPKGSDGKSMKEDPVKEHDHGMDAARYMCSHLDSPGPSSMGVMVGGSKAISGGTIPRASSGGSYAAIGGRGGDMWRTV
jgi:hypothetical protein